MNENIKFLKIKIFVFSFLSWGGVIGILFLSFFSCSVEYQKCFNEVQAVTIAPSVTTSIGIPINLTATAISSSQINLTWNSVAGAAYYNIYRDDAFNASSSNASYSDTGLIPLTAYTYTVTAVDTNEAESSHSSSASATTLAVEVEEEAEAEGGALPIFPPPPEDIFLVINNGDIYTNSLDAILTLSAKNAFQMAVSDNSDFADAVWESYQTIKKLILTGGDGEKTIYAKFRSSSGGVSKVISDSIILDTVPPINVSNFEAIADDEQIILRWENPLGKDFGGVRIMGSTIFYPSSPSDGILLYDGGGISFTAVGLTNGVKYYYTIFAYDKASNFSSGAVVSATPFREEPPPPPPPPPPLPPPPPEIEKLILEDFDFWQEEEKVFPEEEIRIRGKANQPLTIFLDYEKVPEVLKTIMVTLEKGGKSFSFLLRINPEKTKYEATLLAPQDPGIYNLTLDILNYKNQILKKISGYLIVEESEVPPPLKISWYRQTKFWFYLLLGIIVVAAVGYLVWKIRMKKLRRAGLRD